MTVPHDSTELLLSALRYSLGEMSAIERESFEQQLSHDQTARDALADVVLWEWALQSHPRDLQVDTTSTTPVSQSIRSAEPSHYAKWQRLSAGVVVATLLLGLVTLMSLPERRAVVAVVDQTPKATTAALWASLASESSELSPEFDESTEPMDNPLTELDVPDWMFAAVEASETERPAARDSIAEPDDEEETL